MTAYATPESLAAAAKANAESMLSLTEKTFASMERLTALNLNTARGLLDDSIASARILADARDMKTVVGLQAGLVKPGLEKAVAYSRSVYDISTDVSNDFASLLENQLSEANKALVELINKLAASPLGSDAAVAALKQAIVTANSAYDNLNTIVREAGSAADANINVAAKAAVQAVDAAFATLPA